MRVENYRIFLDFYLQHLVTNNSEKGKADTIKTPESQLDAKLAVIEKFDSKIIKEYLLYNEISRRLENGGVKDFEKYYKYYKNNNTDSSYAVQIEKLYSKKLLIAPGKHAPDFKCIDNESNYVSLAEPFSEELRDNLIESAIIQGITVQTKGIVISIDGQRSSSRAESNLYRTWNADVINMTTAPEVILARELGMSYAALSLCTGYDSWRNNDFPPDPAEKMALVSQNHDKIVKLLAYALKKLQE